MSGQMPISTETYRSGGSARSRKRAQMLAMYLIGVAIGLVILGLVQQGRRNAATQAQLAAERERQAVAESEKKAAGPESTTPKQPTP